MCLKNISVCLVLCSGGVHELLSGTEPYPELCGRGRDTGCLELRGRVCDSCCPELCGGRCDTCYRS